MALSSNEELLKGFTNLRVSPTFLRVQVKQGGEVQFALDDAPEGLQSTTLAHSVEDEAVVSGQQLVGETHPPTR